MIGWRDNEDHAANAAEKGFTVQSKKFKGSGHCARARVPGEIKYWAIVDRSWQSR